jgi:hypothetical protein
MGLENHLENPKLWTIAHKPAQKHKKMGLVNHLKNPT